MKAIDDEEFKNMLVRIATLTETREKERAEALETIREIKQLILAMRKDIVSDLMQQIKQDLDSRIASADTKIT